MLSWADLSILVQLRSGCAGSLVPVLQQGLELQQLPFATRTVSPYCLMLVQTAAADAAESGRWGLSLWWRLRRLQLQQAISEDACTALVLCRYDEARSLLKSSAQVDMRDDAGNTPLILACQAGHGRLIKLLLRKGADINACNSIGRTALQAAASGQHHAAVKYLRSLGAV